MSTLDPATPAGDTHLCNDIRPDGTPGATHSCGEQVVTALVTAGATLNNAYGASTNWLCVSLWAADDGGCCASC